VRPGRPGAAKSFLTETVSRVRGAGGTGQLIVRADSAFYSKAVLHTAIKFNVQFSVTARQDKKIRAAIETIDESAWQPIPYWLSTPEVSGADVAETSYTAFSGKDALTVRLIVRRVRPTPGSQLALFTAWDYHAFVTNRPGDVLEVEADHRRHAIVEQRIAELKSAGLAHLPSGNFMANATWLALTVVAHNLGRAVGLLAEHDLERATAASLQRKIFTIPGRLVHSGRRRHLRLPASWPWAEAIERAIENIQAIPPLLNNHPVPTTRTSEKPVDRRLPHAQRRLSTSSKSISRPTPRSPRQAVDPGLGAALQDVQDALGHADTRTTRRYDRNRNRLDQSPNYLLAGALSGDGTPS